MKHRTHHLRSIVLQSSSIPWIARRKTNCLGHLRSCKNQAEEVRLAAKDELDAHNALRRDARRAKNKPPEAAALPLISANAASPDSPHAPNVTDRDPSLPLEGSTTIKVSYSSADTIVPEEAFNVPYPIPATDIALEDPAAFHDLPPITTLDVALGYAPTLALQMVAAREYAIMSQALLSANYSLFQSGHLPFTGILNDSQARAVVSLSPFILTIPCSNSYLQPRIDTGQLYPTPMTAAPGWARYTSTIGSPVAPISPVDAYVHGGSDDIPLTGMFVNLNIDPEEQLAYSYRRKELAPPPGFEPQMAAPPYGGGYDPSFFGF